MKVAGVKEGLLTIFSLRLVVVAVAVGLLVMKNQFILLSEVDQALFHLAHGVTSSSQPVALWPIAFQPAESFSAQLVESGLFEPYYFRWIEILLASMVASFLVIILPRLPLSTGAMTVLLMLVTLSMAQLYLQIFRQQWVPLGLVIQVLSIGYVIMLFWLQPNRQLQRVGMELQKANVRLSRMLSEQGQLQEADDLIARCTMEGDALETAYDIALQQERKRQYDRAIASYQRIVKVKRHFKDAERRLIGLQQMEPTQGQTVGEMALTKTLVLSEQHISKPTLGRYTIERELGRGEMGIVYLAHDPKIARTVAVKTLNFGQFAPSQIEELKVRFFREAEAAGRLNHPGIVTIYDVGEEPDLAYIAMDYAEGQPLSHFSKPSSLLPIERVLEIILNVAEALAYAHQHHIVHRDIKPGNIIYNPADRRVKVTDFGIAKMTDESKTKTGHVMGSPLYMSPEQLMGQKVTGRSDLYSLGVTFYQLLTGRTPFESESLANLTYQILNQKPKSIRSLRSDIPAGVSRIINKTLQKDPTKRFESARSLAVSLQNLLEKKCA